MNTKGLRCTRCSTILECYLNNSLTCTVKNIYLIFNYRDNDKQVKQAKK
ncbi:hypothetical protein XBP1_2080006 [Xenorhabdus bovienii str. puntauvense]|uniref:Uncharacterized protein n=1 Tax=Xenorhabdus bovienii str. puntauvense TaxID=1398201 RepID=A0A077NDI2_XENBV|nr:hypothetical protein XBFFR1_660003 [Xenorhabdus bovienii str. feltiae France]CDG93922.1 hypothetical protein XBFFL1_280003 [Xenorhabdus bovienii str. feltiae Florida]CDG96423.1 hypothetical protein XBP1_2080006 [Xenorhabdus bovienii str. puntauvense]